MRNILTSGLFVLAVIGTATAVNAGYKHHSSAAAQQIDDAARTYLSECIADKSKSIKHCYKQAKHMMKEKFKAAEKAEENK
mgnify:CR=1 FL=1